MPIEIGLDDQEYLSQLFMFLNTTHNLHFKTAKGLQYRTSRTQPSSNLLGNMLTFFR